MWCRCSYLINLSANHVAPAEISLRPEPRLAGAPSGGGMSRQWTKTDFDKKNAENAAEETAVMERLPSKFHMNCTIYTTDQAQAALRKHF